MAHPTHQVDQYQTVVFAGGCFWCTEAVFKMLKGVQSVTPGYAGGTTPHPSYEDVVRGGTGHAEVTRVVYDPARISFDDLLTVFFATHDPTSVNRQGSDVGPQYRSAIFYTTDAQRDAARQFIHAIQGADGGGASIVTSVQPLEVFYEAESYHQDYYARNASQPYCQLVIDPKLIEVRKRFAQLIKHAV